MKWPEWVKNPKESRYVVDMQGKDYVTKSGLSVLCNEMFGPGMWSVWSENPTPDEIESLRKQMGMKPEEPVVILKGLLEAIKIIEGQTVRVRFSDFGTAHRKNLQGFVPFDKYSLEMASTRATNRVMRLPTGAPTSVDELPGESVKSGVSGESSTPPDGWSESPPRYTPNQGDQEKANPATDKQKNALINMARNLPDGDELKAEVEEKKDSMTFQEAQRFFTRFNNRKGQK